MKDDFLIGCNTHNYHYESYSSDKIFECIEIIKKAGMNIMRYNFNPKTYEEYKKLDAVVTACLKSNIELMLVLDSYNLEISSEEYCEWHGEIAKRYKDKIKYYQIFNELDVYTMGEEMGKIYVGGDGNDISQYNPKRLSGMPERIKASILGIHKSDRNAKICINYCWWHTAFLEYLTENGCKWDIIGIDWYSDMENKSSVLKAFNWLTKKYPSYDLMICETNYWMYFAKDLPKEIVEKRQADWCEQFLQTVYYSGYPKVKGIIFYELLDQPATESEKFCPEAHFGFFTCNAKGEKLEKKPVYDRLSRRIKKL